MLEIVGGLDATCGAQMLANLELTQGLAMSEAVSIALAADIGRARAHELVEEASKRAIAEVGPCAMSSRKSPRFASTSAKPTLIASWTRATIWAARSVSSNE